MPSVNIRSPRDAASWTRTAPRKFRAFPEDSSDVTHLQMGLGHTPAAPELSHTGPYTDGLLYGAMSVGMHFLAADVGADAVAEESEAPVPVLLHMGAGHACATVLQNGCHMEGLLKSPVLVGAHSLGAGACCGAGVGTGGRGAGTGGRGAGTAAGTGAEGTPPSDLATCNNLLVGLSALTTAAAPLDFSADTTSCGVMDGFSLRSKAAAPAT